MLFGARICLPEWSAVFNIYPDALSPEQCPCALCLRDERRFILLRPSLSARFELFESAVIFGCDSSSAPRFPPLLSSLTTTDVSNLTAGPGRHSLHLTR